MCFMLNIVSSFIRNTHIPAQNTTGSGNWSSFSLYWWNHVQTSVLQRAWLTILSATLSVFCLLGNYNLVYWSYVNYYYYLRSRIKGSAQKSVIAQCKISQLRSCGASLQPITPQMIPNLCGLLDTLPLTPKCLLLHNSNCAAVTLVLDQS